MFLVFRSNELDLLVLQNGKNGAPGESKYTWVKYSQNSNGVPMTDDPTDAVYMGISYNRDTSEETENPNDYTWIKVLGNNGQDAYTIYLTNENVNFAIEYDTNELIANQTFSSEVKVFYGTNERTDFTIGEVSSSSGITISVEDNLITLHASKGTLLEKESGYFRIPVNIDGLVFFKDILWNTSRQGAPGVSGDGALNIIVENESQMIACTNEGLVQENTLFTIPFSAYKGLDQIACTAVVGVLPSGMTLGSNTPSTETSTGNIALNVAKNATLGDSSLNTGSIDIIFTVDSQSIERRFIWTKVKDGANGSTYSLKLSTVVLSKGFNNELSPSSITMNAYQIVNGEQVPYNGRFIVSQSVFNDDGVAGSYSNVYISNQNESKHTYTVSNNIAGIIVYLCESDNTSNILDQQSVIVLTNIDEIRPEINKIQSSIDGVSSTVDNINNQIVNKVWKSDITESINNYDGTTIKDIRDQQSQMIIDIGGIETNVSDIKSTFENDIQKLTEKTSQLEQDANGFKQTVSATYATKDELNETSSTLTTTIEQTAEQISHEVSDLSGNVSENTQNIGSITQRVQTAEGNISSLQITASNIKSEIEDARGNSSSLSQRIDGISSEVETIDGKVSNVEQTANSIKSEVATKQPFPYTSFRYIRDWLNGCNNGDDNFNYYVECRVMVGDENIANGLTAVAKNEELQNLDVQPQNISVYTDDEIITYDEDDNVNSDSYVSTGSGKQCLQLDLGSIRADIDYIQVIHYYIDERIYNHKLEVSEDGLSWVTLYDSDISGGYIETQNGRVYNISDGYINNKYSQISQTVNGITSVVENNSENISRLEQTSSSFTSTIQQIQSDISNVNNNIQDMNEDITSNYSSIQQNIDEIKSTVSGLSGDMTNIAQSVVEQSSTEWKALFSQIGMGNYPNKNTNVIMSVNGLTVKNPDTGVETVMSPQQFAGYYLGDVIFQLNQDLTITSRIQVDNGADFTTIKYINRTYKDQNGNNIKALVHIKSGGSS